MIINASGESLQTNNEESLPADSHGEYEAALAALKSATETQATEESFRNYGRANQKLGRWKDAEDAYLRAIELAPLSPLPLQLMGSLWAARTDKDDKASFETAKAWMQRATALAKDTHLLTELGCVYVALDDIELAERTFREALDMNSANEEAMYNLALLRESADPEEARQLLMRALDIDAEYCLAHQALGKLLQRSGDFRGAQFHFRRCLEIDPNDYWSTLYLANCLAVMDEDDRAEQFYKRAICLDPEVESGYMLYANFLDSIDEPARAAEVRENFTKARR